MYILGDHPESFIVREYGNWHKLSHNGKSYDVLRSHKSPLCLLRPCCEQLVTFIDLRYAHSTFIHAIYIYETFNPGAVVAIWGGKS